jgi:hypothetical protein
MLHNLPTIYIKISTNIVFYLEKYYIKTKTHSGGFSTDDYYIFNELSFGNVSLYILTNINTFYSYKRYSFTKSFNYYN